jgi:hypothetical protein
MLDTSTGDEIAEVNLKTAAGLPGAEGLDIPRYLERLDSWAKLVGAGTEAALPIFQRCRAQLDDSIGKFRMLALVTVLQRDLGVRYDPACQEGPYSALDPRRLFIHGLLDGGGGTCVTMPVLYIAIGRRLGYPLHLVQAREHFFVRWQEPGGERFNVEATALGFLPRDDEHFRRWPKPVSDEEVRQGIFLQNLSPPEELAAFLRERGQCWLEHLRTRPALEAFAQAARLNPRLPRIDCALAIGRVLHRAVEHWGRESLFALPAAALRLPPPENPRDAQLRPLALQELRRIVTNYRQQQRDRLLRNQAVYCHQ